MCGEIEFGDDPTAVYRLYDGQEALLYVGMSFDLAARMAGHAARSPWWGDVARKTMQWYPTRREASAAETAAIAAERPRYNKRMTSSPTQGRVRSWTRDDDLAARYAAGELVEVLPGTVLRKTGPGSIRID